MRLLVTGGAGFIGSNFCDKMIQNGHGVICLDDFNDYYDPQIKRNNICHLLSNPQFRLIEGDILDRSLLVKVFQEEKIDVVVHLAARAGVRPSILNPDLYQKVNVEGTLNLLEMSKEFDIRKFILASSSSVYGNNQKIPFSEEDPVNFPISPYAATKRSCELMAYPYYHIHALSITCLRFFTVYGPRSRPDMAIYKFTGMIARGEEIPLFGDGSSRRDYTYIDDVIDGMEKSVQKCDGYNIYNLGDSQTVVLHRLIKLLESALCRKAKVNHLPVQKGDVSVTFADISKARKELDYAPRILIDEGIVRFVEWYKSTKVKSMN